MCLQQQQRKCVLSYRVCDPSQYDTGSESSACLPCFDCLEMFSLAMMCRDEMTV